MTTLSIYYLSSSNPVRLQNDLLFAVTMDGWDPAKPFDEDDHPDLPPWELTYKDAMAIRQSDIPTRQAAMFKATFIVQPERQDVHPFLVAGPRHRRRLLRALRRAVHLRLRLGSRHGRERAEQVAV